VTTTYHFIIVIYTSPKELLRKKNAIGTKRDFSNLLKMFVIVYLLRPTRAAHLERPRAHNRSHVDVMSHRCRRFRNTCILYKTTPRKEISTMPSKEERLAQSEMRTIGGISMSCYIGVDRSRNPSILYKTTPRKEISTMPSKEEKIGSVRK